MKATQIAGRLAGGMSLLVLLSGCGKKGPLLFPDLLVPEAPQSVQVEQVGDQLQLSFALPAKDKAGRRLREQPSLVMVQRHVAPADDRGACGGCQQEFHMAARIDSDYPEPARREGNRIVYLDRDVRQGERYQYRLHAIGRDGEQGAVAESFRATLCSVPATPHVRATAMHGGFVLVETTAVVADTVELIGYAVYRAAATEQMPVQPLTLTRDGRFEDLNVQPGVTYRYATRLVVRRADDLVAYSELSAEAVIVAAAELVQ